MLTQITQTLEHAIDGLLYTSESDEPFEVVRWPSDGKPLDAHTLLKLAKYPPNTPVSTISLEDFFKDLTTVQSWYGDKEKATVQKYKELENTIRQNLSNAQVFRVGEVQIEIYVIGTTPQGDWAGVKTTSVET